MADHVISSQFHTFSISSSGDRLQTRGRFVRLRNLGANVISVSESANPTGAFTAGAQASINPVPTAFGKLDDILLAPGVNYYIRAATSATLAATEEIPGDISEFGR